MGDSEEENGVDYRAKVVEERVPIIHEYDDKDSKEKVSNFLENMRTQLSWRPPMPSFLDTIDEDDLFPLWVFWTSSDHHEFKNHPTLSSGTVDPMSKTWMEKWVIKEKIQRAFQALLVADPRVLVQFWAPITICGHNILTTSKQPFGLTAIDERLCSYRMFCEDYKINVDGKTEEDLGPLGRAFKKRLPEWTPNVQLYSRNEFPQLDHASGCNVRGHLALPVFEPSEQCSVGVIELVTTSEYFSYAPEVRQLYKVLKDVNLKSSDIFDHPKVGILNEGHQCALDEISAVLRVACNTYGLPLAQTWLPCRQNSCVTTTREAFYVVNAHLWGFWQACSEHHLQKGQGVVGKAFSSHSLCFCRDITQFSKTEYPLVHYARVFRLSGCFAICLRSTHTGNDDYILEFFLPPEIGEQRSFLHRLLATMKQEFRSFRASSGKELLEELPIEVLKFSMHEKVDSIQRSEITRPPLSPPEAFGSGEMKLSYLLEEQQMVEIDAVCDRRDVVSAEQVNNFVTYSEESDPRKKLDRKCEKFEKPITFEVLQQHFGRRLEDAAESLGISRSTLKRVCRQHGISRWPIQRKNKLKHLNGTPLGEKPNGDAGSLKDLGNLHPSASKASSQEPSDKGDLVTVKATYIDTIIRFQLSLTSRMVKLEEEVGKRLNLKVGSFDVKYLDDDGDLVLISCNEDLQYCLGSLRSSGRTTIVMSIRSIY